MSFPSFNFFIDISMGKGIPNMPKEMMRIVINAFSSFLCLKNKIVVFSFLIGSHLFIYFIRCAKGVKSGIIPFLRIIPVVFFYFFFKKYQEDRKINQIFLRQIVSFYVLFQELMHFS